MKSSVQSWFSGSRPYFSRYFAHCVSCGHHGVDEIRVAVGLRDGVAQDQHVAAFLDRHAFAAVIAAAGDRIGAQVVRRVGKFPMRRSGVAQNGTSVALASVGLSKIQIGSIGKNTSTVAMSPLLVFSLVKNSGCLFASAARPQAATHSR